MPFIDSRAVLAGFCAALLLSAVPVAAQTNTAIVQGQGAMPVLLGNNADSASTSRFAPGSYQAGSPIQIVTPHASGGASENPFKRLMDNVNSTMSANANAAAAEREKQLAADAEARAAAYDQAQAKANPNYRLNNKPPAQDGLVIMRYKEPNDKGPATPPHTFHID